MVDGSAGGRAGEAVRGICRHWKTRFLPPLPIQYADYAIWQRDWLEGSDDSRVERGSPLQRQLEYWKKQLAGIPARLDLPTDRPRPTVQTSNGRTHTFRFSRELSQGLARLSKAQGVTMFMTLLAGYQTLLARYSGERDIVVGSALANRQRVEVESLIGFFVNTLVFRTRFDATPAAALTFKELLGRVRETALAHTRTRTCRSRCSSTPSCGTASCRSGT